jgi:hypothetical protein
LEKHIVASSAPAAAARASASAAASANLAAKRRSDDEFGPWNARSKSLEANLHVQVDAGSGGVDPVDAQSKASLDEVAYGRSSHHESKESNECTEMSEVTAPTTVVPSLATLGIAPGPRTIGDASTDSAGGGCRGKSGVDTKLRP